MPFFSRPRHSTAVQRRPVGYLPAFGFFRLPRGVPRSLLSEAYQSSSQRSIPTTVKSGSSTLQKKDDLLNCWTISSDISGYHADFHEGHGTVGAWQGCGMGMAWARHAMCESAFTFSDSIHFSLAFRRSILRGFANSHHIPKNKNISLRPFNLWNIKIVRKLEQVFEPYRMMFKNFGGGGGGGGKQLSSPCYCKAKTLKKKTFL